MGAYGFGLDFCVRNHIFDMYGPILFALGTKTTYDGIHMHIILFLDAMNDGFHMHLILFRDQMQDG